MAPSSDVAKNFSIVCVYMRARAHTALCVYMRACAHTALCVYMCMCAYSIVCVYMSARAHTHYVCVHAHVHIQHCIHVCVCTYSIVCVYMRTCTHMSAPTFQAHQCSLCCPIPPSLPIKLVASDPCIYSSWNLVILQLLKMFRTIFFNVNETFHRFGKKIKCKIQQK